MALPISDKMAMVEKMLDVVDECEEGLKRRAEGRFRPKSLCYAIDPRMVIEVRSYFDDTAPSDSSEPSVQRFEGQYANLGEVVRQIFTAHLDGAVYVTGKELGRVRSLIEQCKSTASASQAA